MNIINVSFMKQNKKQCKLQKFAILARFNY